MNQLIRIIKTYAPPLTPSASLATAAVLLDGDPLDLIERNLISGRIIELRRARAGMVGHRLGVFERAAVGEEIRQTGRPEGVTAHVGVDAGLLGAAADHAPDVDAVHRQRRQRAA